MKSGVNGTGHPCGLLKWIIFIYVNSNDSVSEGNKKG